MGEKKHLLSSKDLALTMKIEYVVRIVMEKCIQKKEHWPGKFGGLDFSPSLLMHTS